MEPLPHLFVPFNDGTRRDAYVWFQFNLLTYLENFLENGSDESIDQACENACKLWNEFLAALSYRAASQPGHMAFANRYFFFERLPTAYEIRHYQLNCAPTVTDDSTDMTDDSTT